MATHHAMHRRPFSKLRSSKAAKIVAAGLVLLMLVVLGFMLQRFGIVDFADLNSLFQPLPVEPRLEVPFDPAPRRYAALLRLRLT